MTEEVNTIEETRHLFLAYIAFEIPQAGPTQIAARDKDHARELLTEAHKNMANFKIIDIFDSAQVAEFAKHGVTSDVDEDSTVH